MSAKDMIIDFVNTVFIIVLSIFCFFYFIIFDNMDVAKQIVKTAMVFSVFGMIFLIKMKIERIKIKKIKKEFNLDKIILYLSKLDLIKDIIVILLLSFIVFIIAFIEGSYNNIDIYQIFFILVYLLSWHFILFRKKDNTEKLIIITNLDKYFDDFIIFVMPILFLLIPLFLKSIDIIDIFQVCILFVILYLWRKILFKDIDRV